MSSPASLTAGLCCICFARLSSPALDMWGERWDVCAGECAFDAGILEWNLLTAAGQSVADRADEIDIRRLIERSSLGSPRAKAFRRRTPPTVLDRALARLFELDGADSLDTEAGLKEIHDRDA